MNNSPRRSLALLLCAALIGGLISPETARAAAPMRINLGGQAGTAGASAAAGVLAPLTLGAPLLAASPAPAALLISAPVLAAPSLTAAPSAAPAAVAPALSAAPSAASAPIGETPSAPRAAAPAASSSWLSRAAALFSRPASPNAAETAPVSAAAAKTDADRTFDGAAAAPAAVDAAVPAPAKPLMSLRSALPRLAAYGVEAYKTRRAVAHDDFGGPKSDGPMTLRDKVRYGVKWGLNLVGLGALIDFTVAPLMSHLAWPLFFSAPALAGLGRVELLTKFGPAAIGAALSQAPLSFLGISLPLATAMEEFTYRFMGFGLTFGLLAAAKPVANLAANLLDSVPDASGFRSTVQRGVLAVGRLLSYFAFPVAALTSSFSFAVAHFAQWGVDPSVFALNMVAGWFLARAAYKTRGLAAPFVAHLVFNLAMLGSAILGVTFGLPLAATVYSLAASLVGIGALWYNWRASRGLPAFSLKGVGAGAKNLTIAALIAASAAGGMGLNSSSGSYAPARSEAVVRVLAKPATEPTLAVPPSVPQAVAEPASGFKTAADMIASVKPSVVEIIIKMPQGYAIGSGVIVSPDGLLATNGHVIGDKRVGESVVVKLANDQKVPAKVMAVNHNLDLAVLQLPKLKDGAWPYSTFAQTAPREGDALYAMGHPLGLPFTVTKGVLSGIGDRGNMFVQYLQTDASINHGNSGGPIYNERGQIVGINTMIAGKEGSIGIGFSIVAPSVAHALQQYVETGSIATASLGVIVDLSNPDQPQIGVAVEFVRPGSPAAKAGLLPGDLIVAVDGAVIPHGGKKAVHDLGSLLAQARPGDVVQITVFRGGMDKPTIVKLTLGARATSEETSMAHDFDGESDAPDAP